MWNRQLKFEPDEIIGLLLMVENETSDSLVCEEPVTWVSAPYDLIPYKILAYESLRLMHTLVSGTQPEGWHNAVEEALLYGLCKELPEVKPDDDFAIEIRQTVNAFRRRVQLPPIRNLRDLNADDWEIDVLDVLLFSDRDWQMANASMILHPEVREYIGIAENYFDVRYRNVTEQDLENAWAVFRELLDRAQFGLPATGLPLIPTLHET